MWCQPPSCLPRTGDRPTQDLLERPCICVVFQAASPAVEFEKAGRVVRLCQGAFTASDTALLLRAESMAWASC